MLEHPCVWDGDEAWGAWFRQRSRFLGGSPVPVAVGTVGSWETLISGFVRTMLRPVGFPAVPLWQCWVARVCQRDRPHGSWAPSTPWQAVPCLHLALPGCWDALVRL